MPSEGPEGRESGLADHVVVRLDDFLGRTVNKEVNVDDSTCGDVTQSAATITSIFQDWGLSV